MTPGSPRLSFGVPVRNGEKSIARTLGSLLAQDFEDFEVVVCDNDSTDDTGNLTESYARRDPRVRYVSNGEDIGQIQNFNRVFERSHGEYFRWVGSGDVLDPTYASKCISALDADPEVVGATTLWEFRDAQGAKQTSDFHGERLESASRPRRLARLLWSQTEDRLHLDPIYSMMRREALLRTKLLQISAVTDHLLALQMVLLGRFCHIREVLACRDLPERATDIDVLVQKYHPSLRGKHRTSFGSRYAEFRKAVEELDLPLAERFAISAILWYFRFRAPLYREARRLQGRLSRG
jgi:glycosyltransferase involved in cell wall biosynthesis